MYLAKAIIECKLCRRRCTFSKFDGTNWFGVKSVKDFKSKHFHNDMFRKKYEEWKLSEDYSEALDNDYWEHNHTFFSIYRIDSKGKKIESNETQYWPSGYNFYADRIVGEPYEVKFERSRPLNRKHLQLIDAYSLGSIWINTKDEMWENQKRMWKFIGYKREKNDPFPIPKRRIKKAHKKDIPYDERGRQ